MGETREKVAFFGLTAVAFDDVVTSWGWPRFRAQQVRDWVYQKLIADPEQMTNLSRADRQALRERVDFATAEVTAHQQSSDGTQKLLLTWGTDDESSLAQGTEPGRVDPGPTEGPSLAPGQEVSGGSDPTRTGTVRFSAFGTNAETVMIPDADRRTACVSSQVGCPVGCRFCASGMNGVKGNLTAAQIVEQVYQLNRRMKDEGGRMNDAAGAARSDSSFIPHPSSLRDARITNVVFMGMGEPMANYAAVLQAVRILHDPKCFNLGARRITISTVGVPPKIRQLAGEELPLNLALSLHAPNEPLRKELIPWAEHFALDDILDACRYYFDQTGREITLEYILLCGVNDRPEHARQLAKLCRSMRANVNLIRYNEVESLPYLRPKSDDVLKFQHILRDAGVNAHVRKSRGRDIDAACGQLRRKQEQQRDQAAQPPEPLVTLGVPAASASLPADA